VTRNDGIWNPREAPMPEVDVGTADFGPRRAQQCSAGRKMGARELADVKRRARR